MIYLDSCLLIYSIENDSRFGPRTRDALKAQAKQRFAISPLSKLECLVKPIRDGDLVLQQHYEAALDTLVLLPMPEAVYLAAALLRARFALRTPDALHLACAQHHACTALWTNDERLARAGHGLARNVFKSKGDVPR